MLPRPLRVRESAEHRVVARRGTRARVGTLSVSRLLPADVPPAATSGRPGRPPRAGLAVSRAVGNSVARHRVSRRLRHLLAQRLPGQPAGALIVVRALPGAAEVAGADLARELDAALTVAGRRRRRSGSVHR